MRFLSPISMSLAVEPSRILKTLLFVVIACVDCFDLVVDHLRSDRDYCLCGLSNFVGKSSMEVLVVIGELDPNGSEAAKKCLSRRFIKVAMNGLTKKSQQIPAPRLYENDESSLSSVRRTRRARGQRSRWLGPCTADSGGKAAAPNVASRSSVAEAAPDAADAQMMTPRWCLHPRTNRARPNIYTLRVQTSTNIYLEASS